MKKTDQTKIVIEPLNIKSFTVKVGGDRMLMNKRDAEVESLLKRYFEESKKPKEKKQVSKEDIIRGKIHMSGTRQVVFPVSGFKTGLVDVAPRLNLTKTLIKGAIQILGGFTPIKYKKMVVNEAWGKTSGISRTWKETIRPEFQDWSCYLTIKYNADIISADQIITLLNWAGFHQGIGDWRPACNGSYGQYQVLPSKKK